MQYSFYSFGCSERRFGVSTLPAAITFHSSSIEILGSTESFRHTNFKNLRYMHKIPPQVQTSIYKPSTNTTHLHTKSQTGVKANPDLPAAILAHFRHRPAVSAKLSTPGSAAPSPTLPPATNTSPCKTVTPQLDRGTLKEGSTLH